MDGENIEILSGSESNEAEKDDAHAEPLKKKQKTNPSGSGKGKGKGTRSVVWHHFTQFYIEGIPYGQCNYCPEKKYKADGISNGTSSMLKHMRKCPNHPSRLNNQKSFYITKDKDGEGGKANMWSFDSVSIRNALIKMVIVDELPFSFVEKEGFKEFMEAACPRFKIPSRTTISRDVFELFHTEKQKLKAIFRKGKQRVSLTTDTWTSIQRVNYMVVTAHYIDDTWKLQKRIISFKPVCSHKGEDIGREILDCLHDWGIDHLMTITTDNASSNDTALVFLKNKMHMKLILGGEYLQMRCTAHILNLIVKDGMKRYNSSLERVRGAVKYIRNSTSRCDLFKACVDELKLECKAMLHLDCPTRWNSTYDMLDTAEKLKQAFDLYENKDRSYVHDLGSEIPTSTDWYCIKKLTQFLAIFKRKTEIVSGTSYVVANSFFNEVVDLDYQLDKVKTDRDLEYRLMASAMKDKFDKYWGSIKKLNMLMYFAVVLDPRMKMPIVRYGFKRICDMKTYKRLEEESIEEFQTRVDRLKRKDLEDHVSFVDDAMKIFYDEYRIMYEEGSSNVNSESQGYVENMIDQENEFVEAFLKESDNSNVESATELEKYKAEPREKMVKVFDILMWWKDHSPRFPILSKMAKDILAIPVSSVASESAFSTSGRVLDAFRSSLSPSKVEALICAQDWLRISRNSIDTDGYLDGVETLTKGILESVKDNNCGTLED